MSRLFVHLGLHKTGTTALQVAFSRYAERLLEQGVLFPRAGRISEESGHHNIAWQLVRDRRFQRTWGDLDALATEVKHFEGDVVVSSEGFEGSVHREGALKPFSDIARDANKQLIFVLYVRDQITYLESLYQQILRHGFGEEYLLFANSVLSDGSLRLKERVFHFDYLAIVDALTAIPGVTVTCRNFHALPQGSVVPDFSSILGIGSGIFDSAADLRINQRDSYAQSLELFYQNRLERPLDEFEKNAIAKLSGALGPTSTTGHLRDALIDRFGADNMRLCNRYGMSCDGLDFKAAVKQSATPTASLQAIFSFETQLALGELAALGAQPQGDDARQAKVEASRRITNAWMDFVLKPAFSLD